MTRSEQLQETITQHIESLSSVEDDKASIKPSPDKWSQKEIIGHLIDSAINNHRRFILAAQQEDLIFEGYDQDHWVNFQNYNDRPWQSIIQSFENVNSLIALSFQGMPDQLIRRPTTSHNIDEIGFRKVQKGDAMTLDFLMEDYILHMQHHLAQVRKI